MNALAITLAIDVHKSIGSPNPENEYKVQFKGGAFAFIGLCQADTYLVLGDIKMEKKVRAKLRMYMR